MPTSSQERGLSLAQLSEKIRHPSVSFERENHTSVGHIRKREGSALRLMSLARIAGRRLLQQLSEGSVAERWDLRFFPVQRRVRLGTEEIAAGPPAG
jgi:hypothetical protein